MVKDLFFISGEKNYSDENFLTQKLDEIKNSYNSANDFCIIRLETLKGVDGIIRKWAVDNEIQTISVPVLWKKHGFDAKNVTNTFIIERLKPSYLLTFGNDQSLAFCVTCARNNKIPVYNF